MARASAQGSLIGNYNRAVGSLWRASEAADRSEESQMEQWRIVVVGRSGDRRTDRPNEMEEVVEVLTFLV